MTAFVYDPQGRFLERVEAQRANLQPGSWTLVDARAFAPGQEPKVSPTYTLATSLTPEQVSQSFVHPASVSFWSCRRSAAGRKPRDLTRLVTVCNSRPLWLDLYYCSRWFS